MAERDERLTRAEWPAQEALRLHPFYRGKVQMLPKCPITSDRDFAIRYTPGVAASCREIQKSPELVYEHTNKANVIAIVSDGSRVLGLGDIGPEAGRPVMEGKALLFKYLGGIDAVPLCVRAQQPDDIVRVVQMIEPSFGGSTLRTSPSHNASRCSTLCAPNSRSPSGMTISRARPRSSWPG
jgi:malate dehydrogenase (oxaloacetate-decarboxylating)